MKIKTFYARTWTEALAKAKREFGPEAMILSSQEKSRSRGGSAESCAVEVTAAIDEADDFISTYREIASEAAIQDISESVVPQCSQGTRFEVGAAVRPGRLKERKRRSPLQVDAAYNEMRRSLRFLAQPANTSASLFSESAACELYQDLLSNEVSEWLAYKLLDEAQRDLPPEERRQRARLAKSVNQVACGLIRNCSAQDGLPSKRLVAFVGPTGVGKTTAIAKLGARLALGAKKKVLLVSMDGYRIGAVEQLKTYAGLMGLPFRAVRRVEELSRLIQDQGQRDYILIDTTGRNQRDLSTVEGLMNFLRESPSMERHLVLSATTKSVDTQEIVDRFAICEPDRLLFTKLDETSTFGPIFN
jgi:flagellar biosynthesis protein FlhF